MTTQQERTCSVLKLKKKKHGKVCQACVVRCCPAILLLSYIFSYYPSKKKKKREEKGPKAIFEKEWPKPMYVLKLSLKHNHRCSRSNRLKGYLASWCRRSAPAQAFIQHACCLLQQTMSHTTPSIAHVHTPICDEARLLPVLLPAVRWKKKGINAKIMKYKKHHTDTKTFFLLL